MKDVSKRITTFIVLTTISATMAIILFSTCKFSRKQSCESLSSHQWVTESLSLETSEVFSIEKTIELQYNNYQSKLTSLNTNTILQLFFIIISILIIFRPEAAISNDSLRMPLLEVHLPLSWLHIIVPVALMFLWIQFGFLLNETIAIREGNWNLICKDLVSYSGRVFYMTNEQIRNLARLFEDAFVIDAWFFLFETEHLMNEQHGWFTHTLKRTVTLSFLLLIYGILLGITHASILTIPYMWTQRYLNTRRYSWLWWRLLIIFFVVLMLVSHWQFYEAGPRPNCFQFPLLFFVWGFTAFFINHALKRS